MIEFTFEEPETLAFAAAEGGVGAAVDFAGDLGEVRVEVEAAGPQIIP